MARDKDRTDNFSWRDIGKRVRGELKRDHISIVAAGIAFYALLSIFPALAAVVALYGLVSDPAEVQRQVQMFSGVLPPDALRPIEEQLNRLVQSSGGALGFGAALGILLATWSATQGMRALMEGFNIAYDERERRGTLKVYGLALALTVGAIVIVLIALGLVVVVPAVVGFLGIGVNTGTLIRVLRWPFLGLLVAGGLTVLYRYGPSRVVSGWRWVVWGAIGATILWLLGSGLFSIYVSNFGNYNATYGSVAAVVILMLWFYLSSYAILLGAEVNAEMERQVGPDSTPDRPRPTGKRGARTGDTLGEIPS